MCMCVRGYVAQCLGDRNDLNLATVAVLDTMSQPTDFGFKRVRVWG